MDEIYVLKIYFFNLLFYWGWFESQFFCDNVREISRSGHNYEKIGFTGTWMTHSNKQILEQEWPPTLWPFWRIPEIMDVEYTWIL